MRRILTRTALIATVAALAVSAPAFGQAFQPLPPAAPETTTPATTSATTNDDGLGTMSEILLFVAGIGLIGGIAYAIMRDARRVAPVTAEESMGHGSSGAAARKAHSKDAARKRAKAARAARKRQRKR